MVKVTTYKARSSNAIPVIPDGGGNSSKGNIVFLFGTETQVIESCASTEDVKTSKDMCLLGGDYFSASYSALPAKVNGKIKFSSNTAKAPVYSSNYSSSQCKSSSNCILGDT